MKEPVKVGDIVRVVKEGGSHNYKLGQEYVVTELSTSGLMDPQHGFAFHARSLNDPHFIGNWLFTGCVELVQSSIQKEEEKMRTVNLYKVTRVDTTNNTPAVAEVNVVAGTEEEAKIVSGLYTNIPKDSDPAFVTLFCTAVKTSIPAPDKKAV